ADALQLAIELGGDDQAAKIIRSRWQKADDGANQLSLALDLEPGLGALAGKITAGEALGDNTLQILPARFLKKSLAVANNALGKQQTRMIDLLDQSGQALAALDQWPG